MAKRSRSSIAIRLEPLDMYKTNLSRPEKLSTFTQGYQTAVLRSSYQG